jgi:hypothetical protein
LTTQLEPQPAPPLPFSAVFVDLENMAINPEPDHPAFDLARVMKQVRFLSNPIVRMGFADWSKLPQFARTFVLQGFDQIQATYVTGSKNSADMQLCVDALEVVLMRREIHTVFLVSGDADFTPLARAVRRQGRQVIGIGWRDKASLVFRRNCDRFFAYEELPGLSIDEVSELAVADRRSERRLASQQARRSVPAYRPGARPAGKSRRAPARAESEDEAEAEGSFLHDPREGQAEPAEAQEAAAEPAPRDDKDKDKDKDKKQARPERARQPAREEKKKEQPAKPEGQPDDPLVKLRKPPIGFLGADDQFAVLEALHRELTTQTAPRRRNQIVNAAAQKLAPIRRAQVAAVERILWHAKVYDVMDRAGQRNSVLWNVQLRSKYKDFDTLRATHDVQLIADAAEAGIFLSPADWSDQLYGGPEDADIIEDYFREVAGISGTFAKETGIAPPAEEEREQEAEGEEESETNEGAGEPETGESEHPGEAGNAGDAGDAGDAGNAGNAGDAGEAAEAASAGPEADAKAETEAPPPTAADDDAGRQAAEGEDASEVASEGASEGASEDRRPAGPEPEPGEPDAPSEAEEGQPREAAGGVEDDESRGQPVFQEADTGEAAEEPDSRDAGATADAAGEARSGWWSKL